MKKRTVIYARFSSHSQTEQSIEGQLRECYDYEKSTTCSSCLSISTERLRERRTNGRAFYR